MFAFDYDELEEQIDATVDRVRIWAVSDVHTDMKDNKAWLADVPLEEHANDVLILAGDISNKWQDIEETLQACRDRFARVFFVPGNHDLWVQRKNAETSIDKLRRLLELCRKLGVETAPGEVHSNGQRLLIVPILSWHHPQWDTEPEITEWEGISPVREVASDYVLTKWPDGTSIHDGTAAKLLDSMNDEIFDMDELISRRESCNGAISFSHFVPRIELNPEKRYLTAPQLAKAVGSTHLAKRVEMLKPDLHVFGHTHFGYDMDVDGIRYVQAPLSYPQERSGRGTTVAVGQFPCAIPKPCLVWDSSKGWAPKQKAAWSEYYIRYGRKPKVTHILPSYVGASLRPISQDCQIGWLPGRMPAWLFGPRELREMEAQNLVMGVNSFLAQQKQLDPLKEPQTITMPDLSAMLGTRSCNLVDARPAIEGSTSSREHIPTSVFIPHPALTEKLPCLPDDELLLLCERLFASDGPLVILGDRHKSCREAAFLLAAMLRLNSGDVKMFVGHREVLAKLLHDLK